MGFRFILNNFRCHQQPSDKVTELLKYKPMDKIIYVPNHVISNKYLPLVSGGFIGGVCLFAYFLRRID